MAKTAKVIAIAFISDKINIDCSSHSNSHLNKHIVNKYKDGYNFGGIFEMNLQKITLSDSAYNEVISKIKAGI